MKKQLMKFSLLLLGVSLLLSSCKKDMEEENEEEVITTMKLTFVGGGSTKSFEFNDLDGDGGNPPTIDQIVLSANTTYNVTLQLLNKTENPVDDVT